MWSKWPDYQDIFRQIIGPLYAARLPLMTVWHTFECACCMIIVDIIIRPINNSETTESVINRTIIAVTSLTKYITKWSFEKVYSLYHGRSNGHRFTVMYHTGPPCFRSERCQCRRHGWTSRTTCSDRHFHQQFFPIDGMDEWQLNRWLKETCFLKDRLRSESARFKGIISKQKHLTCSRGDWVWDFTYGRPLRWSHLVSSSILISRRYIHYIISILIPPRSFR